MKYDKKKLRRFALVREYLTQFTVDECINRLEQWQLEHNHTEETRKKYRIHVFDWGFRDHNTEGALLTVSIRRENESFASPNLGVQLQPLHGGIYRTRVIIRQTLLSWISLLLHVGVVVFVSISFFAYVPAILRQMLIPGLGFSTADAFGTVAALTGLIIVVGINGYTLTNWYRNGKGFAAFDHWVTNPLDAVPDI